MITAVITNYNKRSDLLSRCIESIENANIDYIVVDDCSNDTSHLSKYKNVIRLNENVGAYAAFAIGLEAVSTQYVMRVDADDYIIGIPNISENCDVYLPNGRIPICLNPDEFVEKPNANLNGVIAKKEVLKSVWLTDMRYCGDVVIYSRLISRFDCNICDGYSYFYDRKESGITIMKDRAKHIKIAKERAKKELEEFKNGR